MPGPASFKPDFTAAVSRSESGQPAAIEVRGELDSGSCDELMQKVRGAVALGVPELTLDLRHMTFIDSGGMRALIMIERLAGDCGLSLTVIAPPEPVTELLRTAGLAERMHLEAPPATARPAPTDFIERTQLELQREPYSPARARVVVREALTGSDQSEVANIVLLTSELVTNAVVHPREVAPTPVCLRLIVYSDRIRVEVEDGGQGFDYVVPVLPEGERGRGLFLVDRFSDGWGYGHVQTGAGPRFRVWFEAGSGMPEENTPAG